MCHDTTISLRWRISAYKKALKAPFFPMLSLGASYKVPIHIKSRSISRMSDDLNQPCSQLEQTNISCSLVSRLLKTTSRVFNGRNSSTTGVIHLQKDQCMLQSLLNPFAADCLLLIEGVLFVWSGSPDIVFPTHDVWNAASKSNSIEFLFGSWVSLRFHVVRRFPSSAKLDIRLPTSLLRRLNGEGYPWRFCSLSFTGLPRFSTKQPLRILSVLDWKYSTRLSSPCPGPQGTDHRLTSAPTYFPTSFWI